MTATHTTSGSPRKRLGGRLALAVALTISALMATTGRASAETAPNEDGPKLSHATELCIEILEKGGTADECQQAPDPFLPPWQEIAWSALAFTVVGFGVWKFGRPAVKKAMSNRTERIRGELATAESARVEAEQVRAQYQSQFLNAADEVEAIVTSGREQAERLRRDMAETLQAELAASRARATAEIDAMRTQALADVQAEAGRLVGGLTEHLVRANLDPDVQAALIDHYIELLPRQN